MNSFLDRNYLSMLQKPTLVILLILFLGCQESPNHTKDLEKQFAQNSHINAPDMNQQTLENLELLGRVWGFLKYHHPEVASGNRQWDFEFFAFYPIYMSAKSTQERDQILIRWIEDLGAIPKCKSCDKESKNVLIKPNHSWMKGTNISQELREKLEYIYDNRFQKKQHYVSLKAYIKNPEFTNEKPYLDISYDDSGYALLALFRYWNIIHYFYPSVYLTDTPWDDVLSKYIPIFLSLDNELDYEKAILQLTAEIDDTHAMLVKGADKITEWRGQYHASIRASFIKDQFVVTEYLNSSLQSELKEGDVITYINGNLLQDLVEKNRPFYAASNEASFKKKIAKNLLRAPKKTIEVRYTRGDQELSTELTLYLKSELNLVQWSEKVLSNKFRILNGNIGYIPVVSVEDRDIKTLKKECKNTEGIIIDLRNYPGTLQLIYQFAPYFMTTTKQFMTFTQGNPKNPGEFYFGEPLKFSKNKNAYTKKVVLLVNEKTQSMGEFAAMAYQAGHNTVIVGSQTAGADGDVSLIHLPGGMDTYISGIGIYYPDGKETQRVGIKPDYEVYPTVEGIQQGKDELLEFAIKLIQQKP